VDEVEVRGRRVEGVGFGHAHVRAACMHVSGSTRYLRRMKYKELGLGACYRVSERVCEYEYGQ